MSDCLLDNVGGGAVAADSSLIYVEGGAAGATIENNRVIASARGAATAITSIEVQSNAMVVGNKITDMQNGMNLVGQETTTTTGTTAVGNTITGAFTCIVLWSSNSRGATTYGLSDASVRGNTCVINQRSYLSLGGAMSGIRMDYNANLAFHNIAITGNQVTFDASSTNTDPIDPASIGIGYWDATNNVLPMCVNCNFSNNTVIQAPAAAFRFSANGANMNFDNETVVNPGSSPNVALAGAFRSGVTLGNALAITGPLSIHGGTYTDSQATARWVYGIYLGSAASPNSVSVDGPVITCLDVVCASLGNAIFNSSNDTAFISATVNAPGGAVQPSPAAAVGSTVYSTRSQLRYTWDGANWTYTYPHNTAPAISACGTGSPAAGPNDRYGFIVVGSGAVVTCTVAFGSSFLVQPPFSFSVISNPSAGTGIYPATALYAVQGGTYTSGGVIAGTTGQTCTLTATNGTGPGGLVASVALTGANTIAGATAFTIGGAYAGAKGGSYTVGAGPTSATLTSGTATCSGTAVIASTLNSAYTGGFIVTGANFSGATFSWMINSAQN